MLFADDDGNTKQQLLIMMNVKWGWICLMFLM